MSKIKLSLFFCALVFCISISAQPIVSVVHNDVNTLNRVTPTNLITNGSFEIGGPSTGNPVSYFWTRACNTNKPAGWTVSGDPLSYGFWGYYQSSDASQYNTVPCDNTLQSGAGDNMLAPAGDVNNLLYFGNYTATAGMATPVYNAVTGEYIPRANVAAADAAIFWIGAPAPTAPIILSQTIIGLTAGCYYELEFWATGEFYGETDGIFDLRIGNKHFWLTCPGPNNQHGYGTSERYHVVFQADAATEVIAFKNYGHFDPGNNPAMSTWFGASLLVTGELALDDVIVNQKCITVSGKIWEDNNNDGLSTAEPNYTGGNHYVNLVGPDGKILYSALVDATGNYSFPAPMNTAGLSIQISTTAAALEANPNTPAPPAGYNATTSTSIALSTVTSNIINRDFGIRLVSLPVSLGNFSGTLKDETVVLNWITYNELNAAYFEIERSNTGSFATNDFIVAGKVNASGNTLAQKQYTYSENKDINKVSFYRLKMVDINGIFKYSNIIAIRRDGKNAFVYTVNPNPFTDHINLGIKMSAKGTVTVNLTDLSGRKVISKQITLSSGSNNFNVNDLGQLAKGIYILDISGDGDVMRFKVLKN